MRDLIRTADTDIYPNDGTHEFMTYSVEDAVIEHLKPDGDGHIERIADQSQKCADMLGKLVALLEDKNVLSEDEVFDLVNYRYEKSRFNPPGDTR